ncbi:sensor histidine kinase [Solwaraspora sp. WMMD406]|uniref:sensor histidine kinase n=1 Tax=Solwaraspora sp. WMMD406 TaxID=3016095 RepID=UPI0024180FE2|nr:sensor histidine kinase [Solwaraspora sp. WMMD406]MDG4767983.1 sensor histidine kinase [Solwaraspora sp. WMMD406]
MRASTSGDTGPGWDRWYDRLLVLVPWLLLPASTAIALTQPGRTSRDHAITLGLVGATAGWVYLGHTRVPPDRRRTLPTLIYFAGLLTFSVALMARDVIFLLFAITGFLHAYHLRPWPLGAAGVLGTSVVINTMATETPAATVQSLGTYLGVIVIQTVAISAGIVLAERSAEQHERRQQLVARLEAALEENAGLHAQLLAQAREAGVRDERQRMAGEIHDSLAQGLTGIITQVQAAQRVWHSPTPAREHVDRAREHVDRALALARESLDEARRSVQALQPRQLEAAHLPAALGELARRWADDTGIALRFEVTGEQVALSPAIDVTLLRVAQEALHNVARHADASRVGLTLSYLTDVVLLDIRDDGQGMSGGSDQGFGLRSMVQRVRSVGGAMEIESGPGEGTAISVRVPAIPTVAA